MNLFFSLIFLLLVYCIGVERVVRFVDYMDHAMKDAYARAVPQEPRHPPPPRPIRHREPRVLDPEELPTPPARLETL